MKCGILMMMMCCCRLSPLPHSGDVLGAVWTCLPVAALSLCLALRSLSLSLALSLWSRLQNSARRRIQTSSRVTGPCPMWSLCGQRWKVIPHPKTAEFLLLSLLWTETWEAGRNARGLGHVWAQNRSRCVDRPVQLVLIPAHAYNCFRYFHEPLLPCDV